MLIFHVRCSDINISAFDDKETILRIASSRYKPVLSDWKRINDAGDEITEGTVLIAAREHERVWPHLRVTSL
jgi:hypothetical protein